MSQVATARMLVETLFCPGWPTWEHEIELGKRQTKIWMKIMVSASGIVSESDTINFLKNMSSKMELQNKKLRNQLESHKNDLKLLNEKAESQNCPLLPLVTSNTNLTGYLCYLYIITK